VQRVFTFHAVVKRSEEGKGEGVRNEAKCNKRRKGWRRRNAVHTSQIRSALQWQDY